MTTSRARLLLGVLLALASLVLSGCMTLPVSGPVVDADLGTDGTTDPGTVAAIDARGPEEGQSPSEVVQGFLDAMQAFPSELATAKLFLDPAVRSTWNPERTVVYSDASPPAGGTYHQRVTLTGAEELDARGAWQGRLEGADAVLDLEMRQVDGQYRIVDPPDALVVPETWFAQRYQQVSLYFLDSTGSTLVAEPVYVGTDEKLATALVSGLLAGPGEALRGVARTLLPADLRVDLSVPVTDGVAAISLVGDPVTMDADDVQRMLSQLSWTLGQGSDITAFTLTIGGQPVRTTGGAETIPVRSPRADDPGYERAGSTLYGLRDGLVVAGSPGALEPVEGPWGSIESGVEDIAVSLDGITVAGVVGGQLLVSPLRQAGGSRTLLTGEDLEEPGWDRLGRLWVVDQTSNGAVVRWARSGATGTLDAPGITGEDVTSFLVSRDGTRLVAIVARDGGDRVVQVRVRSTPRGRPVAAVATQVLRGDPGDLPATLVDVVWTSSTTLAVLGSLGAGSASVTPLGVDGSPVTSATLTSAVTGSRHLLGSSIEGTSVFAVTRGGLADLSVPVRSPRTSTDGATALTYAG
ncbi:LpqB family beta-propeller domain-containing protein [Nocardioides bruguierae]|uniref:LpqB family beta-propeller domain-containing protein n=1 Tax=Nocardioides bruguierae TaxID=2945102 RepID=UPI002021742A|nr:LpqB family beta-propeller domain-containing protein [Nocardioides bruguierae]MCL8024964.1 LpqB family beta-propeller domain-containing protein [Nocardioides bruguierae]